MKLYEYQAQKILHKYNVNVTGGEVVTGAEEAAKVYNQLGAKRCVIKAQILAGGRGKGGGVKIVETLDEVKEYTSEIIGSRLVTVQTGKEGIEVYSFTSSSVSTIFTPPPFPLPPARI